MRFSLSPMVSAHKKDQTGSDTWPNQRGWWVNPPVSRRLPSGSPRIPRSGPLDCARATDSSSNSASHTHSARRPSATALLTRSRGGGLTPPPSHTPTLRHTLSPTGLRWASTLSLSPSLSLTLDCLPLCTWCDAVRSFTLLPASVTRSTVTACDGSGTKSTVGSRFFFLRL